MMRRVLDFLRAVKSPSPLLVRLYARLRFRSDGPKPSAPQGPDNDYSLRMQAEKATYKDMVDINVLPAIFHYWSHTYVRPILEEFGVSNLDQFFAKYLHEAAARCGQPLARFISLGSGNCDTEVRIATQLRSAGLNSFVIECLDMNPDMLARGVACAEQAGVGEHIKAVEGDFNGWTPEGHYSAVMANQSLHHMLQLEQVFARVRMAMLPRAYFVVSDMIGRNGHLRWPEALELVNAFWNELPISYRYNRQLQRQEDQFSDWDCSTEGFEGIRAQDILPLLISAFHFKAFIAFGNVIDPFIDRSFGHNFNGDGEWDRSFIDRVHAVDEKGFADGTLTPTHLVGVMTRERESDPELSRGLTPNGCVRRP